MLRFEYKLLIALYFVLLFLSWPAYVQSGDNGVSIATAKAMLNEGSFLIDESFQPKDGNLPNVDIPGKTYSRFGIGLPLLYTPYVVIGNLMDSFMDRKQLDHILFSSISPCFSILHLFALFCCFRSFKLGREKAILYSLISCVFTLNFRYALHDHSEMIQQTLLICALAVLLQKRFHPVIAFLLVSFTILIKSYNIAIYMLFLIYYFIEFKNKNLIIKLWITSFPAFIVISIILLFNYHRFGNPMESGYGSEVVKFSFEHFLSNFIPLLFSLEMGYFSFSPILIFAAFGIFKGIIKKNRTLVLSLSIFCFLYLLSAFFYAPKGAWGLGPRYMIPSISFICLGFSFLDLSKKYLNYTFVFLLFLSCLLSVVFVLQKTQEYDLIRHTYLKEKRDADPQIIGLSKLLVLKSKGLDRCYPESAFISSNGDRLINLQEYESFYGVNTWYNHLCKNKSYPLIGLFVAMHICIFILFYSLCVRLLCVQNHVSRHK